MGDGRGRTKWASLPLDVVLELYEASWEDGNRIGPLNLSSEQAAEIMAAAGIPLADGRPIEPSRFAVDSDPVVDYLTFPELRHRGNVQLGTRRSEHWTVSTGLVCREVRDEYAKSLVAAAKTYQFDVSGALIRVASKDCVTNTYDQTPVQVRSPAGVGPIMDEEALGVMAALLKEFDQFRFSLSATSIKQIDKLERAGRQFLTLLSRYSAQSPPHPPAEIVEAVASRWLGDLRGLRELMETLPRPVEARAQFMGPLQVAFRLLFGRQATTTYKFVGETDKKEADSPFIRFVDAFFRAAGCPCKKNTINKALADCRRPYLRRREC